MRGASSVIFQKALIADIFLETDKIQKWFKVGGLGESAVGGMMPLLVLVLVSLPGGVLERTH
jgi:hypothetical protein